MRLQSDYAVYPTNTSRAIPRYDPANNAPRRCIETIYTKRQWRKTSEGNMSAKKIQHPCQQASNRMGQVTGTNLAFDAPMMLRDRPHYKTCTLVINTRRVVVHGCAPV